MDGGFRGLFGTLSWVFGLNGLWNCVFGHISGTGEVSWASFGGFSVLVLSGLGVFAFIEKKVEDRRRVTVEKRRKGVVENREKKELEERICGPGIGGKKLMKGLCKGKRAAEMFGELWGEKRAKKKMREKEKE